MMNFVRKLVFKSRGNMLKQVLDWMSENQGLTVFLAIILLIIIGILR